MKKKSFILLVLLLTVCTVITVLILCDREGSVSDVSTKTNDTAIERDITSEVEFTVQYARTGSYIEENYYPIVETVTTLDALNEYRENNKDTYYLGRADKGYDDSATGFLDACDSYTKEFFEENGLVFVILEEPSGSIRHRVEYVKRNNTVMDIAIDPIIPEAGTDDMAIWHIIIAVDKDVIPEDEENVRIFYDGKGMKMEHFEFSLHWNTYGISSYDSLSGTLIKTSDTDHPEDYITTCYLPEEQMKNIRNIIEELDITSYPDEYNPHGRGVSTPYMTLSLTVRTESMTKTVYVPETVLSFDSDDEKGQRFLDSVGAIIDILTNTDEWKALPEYDRFYD